MIYKYKQVKKHSEELLTVLVPAEFSPSAGESGYSDFLFMNSGASCSLDKSLVASKYIQK